VHALKYSTLCLSFPLLLLAVVVVMTKLEGEREKLKCKKMRTIKANIAVCEISLVARKHKFAVPRLCHVLSLLLRRRQKIMRERAQ
jgi:hypothetical protein